MLTRILACLMIMLLAGCVAGANNNTPVPEQTGVVSSVTLPPATAPATSEPPTLSPTPVYPWTDESAVMSVICFESAYDAAGQTFVLRSADDHIRFYDLADSSHLCRHPVTRNTFDFSGGRILAGLWSRGTGCTAHHDVLNFQQDTANNRIVIWLHFVTEGDCGYELVRGYWIGLTGVNDVQFVIQ